MRDEAERRVRERAALSAEKIASLSRSDAAELVHELFVYQVELEMQNEELQRVHLELEAARARYFALYDLAPVGYITLDDNGLITEANLTASEMLGVPRAELQQQPLTRWIDPSDQDQFYFLRRQIDPLTPARCELRMRREAGPSTWVQLDVSAGRDTEPQHAMRVVTTDIDARKTAEADLIESEARYRSVVESSKDGLLILQPGTGSIASANSAASKLFDVAAGAELLRRAFFEYAPAQQPNGMTSRQQYAAAAAAALATGSYELEWVQQRASGGSFPGSLRLTRIELAGEILLQATVRDLTEVKKLQAHVAQTDRLATMGMLAAGVGHEINNPLTYLMYALERLERDLAQASGFEVQLEALREALQGTKRIRTITRSLSTFARNESPAFLPQDVNAAITSAITLASNEIQHRATLMTRLSDVPAVMAPDGKLAQVFLNLLINAAHAIREGNARNNRISVRSALEDDHVIVEIVDTGVGMAADVAQLVFEPFYTTKRAGAGSGLGLAICKNILNEIGGDIQLKSEPGVGSRFLCRLPAARTTLSREDSPPVREAGPARKPRTATRILVIDDEAGVRLSTARILATAHQVAAAASGREALAILAKDDAFDLILCDVMMPEMTGPELHAALLRDRPEMAKRLVFMSGGVFTEQTSHYLSRLPHTMFEKPFGVDELLQMVAEYFDKEPA